MKDKKIYGFVLLALIIMLLPIGMVSAKYKQTKDVGTVTLDIAPPILSPNWFSKVSINTTISELIVDSFKPNAQPNTYSELGFKWEEGKPIGYNPDGSDNFKGQVRLFEKNDTAYILAIGKNPVIFPENSNSLFASWKGTIVTERITFNNIDTSNVVDMSNMFYYCANLKSLDVSSFNTSNVTDMNNMFYDCRTLTSLNLSNFETPELTNMKQMFMKCSNLQSLDLSSFSTLNITNMSNLFTDCIQLKQVTLGANFKFKNISDKTTLLPGQKNGDIPGANGLWYISNSGQGYNSTDVAVYHNEHNTTTTYYAVKSEAPSSTNTFSLLTENGTINGAIQGN